MIKDFEEYKTYRARLLDKNVPIEERHEKRSLMEDFRKANPEIFNKLNKNKWSNKGLKLLNPDGSVAKILE
jgi:hypothetical protein